MYAELFNLKEPPFRLTPDPQFLFASKQHSRAKAYMESTIWLADGFVVITGEIGAGKTTLIESFLENLPEDVILAHVSQTQLTPIEFLQAVLTEFGFQEYHERKVELLAKLKDYMVEQYARGKTLLLIVDEAQNLSHKVLEEIRLLSGIESHKEKPLRIILAGQPELADKLDSMRLEQLRQRIRLRFHLSTLTKQETADYIQHRLNVAGAEGRRIFDKDSVDLIFRYTGGVPRLINVLCDTAMLCAFSEEKQTIDVGLINEAINELQWVEFSKRNEDRGRFSASKAQRLRRIRLFESEDDGDTPEPATPPVDAAPPADTRREGLAAIESEVDKARKASEEPRAESDDAGSIDAPAPAFIPPERPRSSVAKMGRPEAAPPARAGEKPESLVPVNNNGSHGTAQIREVPPPASPREIHSAAKPELEAQPEVAAAELPPDTPARLDILFRDQHMTEFDLPLGLTVVGRTADNDLQIRSRFVSRHHIQISTNEERSIAVDLKSTNGMFVGSKRVKKRVLEDGDVLQLGEHKLVYRDLRNASKSQIMELMRGSARANGAGIGGDDGSAEFEGISTEVYESESTS